MPTTEKQVSEGKNEERRIGLETSWDVRPCNNMKDFKNNINYEYYISEAKKLASLSIIEDDAEESQE